jgi:hypothetical protein
VSHLLVCVLGTREANEARPGQLVMTLLTAPPALAPAACARFWLVPAFVEDRVEGLGILLEPLVTTKAGWLQPPSGSGLCGM